MSEDLRQSLATELATDLARAIEAMTSEQPKLKLTNEAPTAGERTHWRQQFSASPGSSWLTAATVTWISLGNRTLKAAGIDDGDEETAKSTFVEILGQAYSMLARSLSGRTGVEWNCTEGGEAPPPDAVSWSAVSLEFGDGATETLFVAFDPAVLTSLVPSPPVEVTPAATAQPAIQAAPKNPLFEKSRTLDLLLDVELPVSVSFGRAQLPLKDVIKLTSGSIVELNRTITEPVEVIVNNCVIARGEVVVVEGNFGVRIQQVISREERLRTLY
jgi:flagellar motor switch protein FliN